MSKERRLGRGLEALLGRTVDDPGLKSQRPAVKQPAESVAADLEDDSTRIVQVSVYAIDRNPFQPRSDFDKEAIRALTESIKEHGMLQPLVVRRKGERFQLISGERRLRAATAAGWQTVPAQLRQADDRQVAELAIVENIQRKDLNALEKAASFQNYLQRYRCTQDELARRVNVDRSTIANLIRLLELPEAVQAALRSGAITQGHARALLPLGDEREQTDFCQKIQRESLSVRLTEERVQELVRLADGESLRLVTGGGEDPPPMRPRSDHLASLEQELRSVLGTKVDIRQTNRRRGRIVIHFKSNEEFERLRKHLIGQNLGGVKMGLG